MNRDTNGHPAGNPIPPPAGGNEELSVGRYRVEARLGSGGTGEVFRAWDPLLRRPVALKRLTPEIFGADRAEEARRRLLAEARSLSALDHPCIAAVFDVVEEGGALYLVEELVNGERLRALIGQPLPLTAFLPIAEGCLSALAAACDHGIVHCDLKPENILVTAGGQPKILDFGLACRSQWAPPDDVTRDLRAPDETPAATGGTPAYVAPEVAAGGRPDVRSDIFSLGIVFYEMLTGRNPFRRATVSDTLASVQHDRPPPPSQFARGLPPALDALVMAMLERDPAARASDTGELLRTLRALGGPARRRRTRRVVAWSAAAAAVVVAVAWLTHSWFPSDGVTGGPARFLLVEPFRNLTGEAPMDFTALGLTEVVLARLADLEGVYVVDAKSDVSPNLVVEGGLQRAKERLCVTYRLLDRRRGVTLGGRVVEGDASDLFGVQNDVAAGIVALLRREYGVARLPRSGAQPTADTEAYALYVEARGRLAGNEEERNVDSAIESLTQALRRDPDFALAEAALAEALWRKWKIARDPEYARRAEETARRATEAAPQLAEARVALGTVLLGTGREAAAAQEFDRALDLDPRSDDAYRGLGRAHAVLGDPAQAEQAFRRAIAARPDYWAGYSALGLYLYGQGRLEDAARSFEKVTELAPDNARGHSDLGGTYSALSRTKDAIREYQRSLEIRPNYRAFSNLGAVYQSLGRYAEAAANYEHALDLDSRDARVWSNLGDAYSQLPEHRPEAERAWREAVERAEAERKVNPRDPLVLTTLAQCHASLGRRAQALQAAEDAVALAPERMDILYYAGAACESAGSRKRALELVGAAVRAGLPLAEVEREPALAALRSDPAYDRVVRAPATAAAPSR